MSKTHRRVGANSIHHKTEAIKHPLAFFGNTVRNRPLSAFTNSELTDLVEVKFHTDNFSTFAPATNMRRRSSRKLRHLNKACAHRCLRISDSFDSLIVPSKAEAKLQYM